MSQFRNEPHLNGQNGEGKIKRYTHSPLTIEHYGIHASIQANGKVVISKNVRTTNDGEVEFDEIEIPASLVFKLASLLSATRKVEYVSLSDTKAEDKSSAV